MIIFILIVLFLLCIISINFKEQFNTANLEYPCRVVLTDDEFLKHMIPHHQMAIDISIEHMKNTKSDIIMKVLRELIYTQKYEVIIMLAELKHKTENITSIHNNQTFNPTISSDTYPNILGLTNTYCDPAFFTYKKNQHNQHNQHKQEHKIITDKQYILHMIPHHQVAVDMCKILLKNTKSDFLIDLSYRMIKEQETEIILLNDLLQSPFIK